MKPSFTPALLWRKLPLVAFLCFILNCSSLMAQETADEEKEEDIVQLDDFVVVTDDGRSYVANNTNSATAFNVEIRDLPVPINVITKQFIEDQGATNFREALAYESGISFETTLNNSAANNSFRSNFGDRSPSSNFDASDPFANAIIIRGYTAPSQQRLGFRVGALVPAYGVNLGGLTDSVNTARQEAVYGPQSLLYGINVLSGVVNIIPKQPIGERGGELRLSLGSRDHFRGSLEFEDVISKEHSLYYRVATSYQEDGHVLDHVNSEQKYAVAQLLWEPKDKTYPHYRVFLEAQYGHKVQHGITQRGTGQYFQNSRSDLQLKNVYGEDFKFGYDYDPLGDPYRKEHVFSEDATFINKDDASLGVLFPGVANPTISEGSLYLQQNPNHDYSFPALGPDYNISGPDVVHDFKEIDLLGLVNISFSESFKLELGAYYTKTDTYRRNLGMGVGNDVIGMFKPRIDANGVIRGNGNRWEYNPELDTSDLYGYGVGELFYGQTNNIDEQNKAYIVRKYAYYEWYETPVDSESIQLRARAKYDIDSSWFDGRVNVQHNFAAGVSYNEDWVNFVGTGAPALNLATYRGPAYTTVPGGAETDYYQTNYANDPLQIRNIFDYSVIRYNGEAYALPGGVNYNSLGYTDLAETDPLDNENSYIARSGFREAKLIYRGFFGVYYGQYFDKKLTLIGGIRHDSYQVRERQQLLAVQPQLVDQSGDRVGVLDVNWIRGTDNNSYPTNVLLGYGDQAYDPSLYNFNDALDAKIAESVEHFRRSYPQGTQRHNFPESQRYTSKTYGFSYRIVDALSLYYIYSEGIFPNTGQRDGADQPIEAEETTNNELGIKFELLDGRLSGSASVYQIKRKNATWQWGVAPAPSRWFGGPNNNSGNPLARGFNPHVINEYLDKPAGDAGTNALTYMFSSNYVKTVADFYGISLNPRQFVKTDGFNNSYGTIKSDLSTINDPTRQNDGSHPFFVIDYIYMKELNDALINDTVDEFKAKRNLPATFSVSSEVAAKVGQPVYLDSSGHIYDTPGEGRDELIAGNPLKLAIDLAIRDRSATGIPFNYLFDSTPQGKSFNASNTNPSINSPGVTVKYEEEGIGFNFGLNWEPISHLNLIFSYSYQKREVTGGGFELAGGYLLDEDGNLDPDGQEGGSAYGPNEGRWTTEYDIWVYVMGINNFEDPTDPTTLKGESVNGIDLSFIPRHKASLWGKYEFTEGFLKGLEIGAGVKYTSASPTSIAIGGSDLGVNAYPTPDIPERFQYDAMLGYRGEFDRYGYRIQLNIYNLTNEDYSYSIVDYMSTGEPVIRKSEQFHEPITWKLSFTLSF